MIDATWWNRVSCRRGFQVSVCLAGIACNSSQTKRKKNVCNNCKVRKNEMKCILIYNLYNLVDFNDTKVINLSTCMLICSLTTMPGENVTFCILHLSDFIKKYYDSQDPKQTKPSKYRNENKNCLSD